MKNNEEKVKIALFKTAVLFFLTTAVREKPKTYIVKLVMWIKSVLNQSLAAC